MASEASSSGGAGISGDQGPAARVTQVVMPSEVSRSGAVSVEDMADASMGGPTHPEASCVNSLEAGADFEVMMSKGKAEMIEAASIRVQQCFQQQGVEFTDQ